MDTSYRTGHAPSGPRSSDSPAGSAAPFHAASITVPVESMQMRSAAQLAGTPRPTVERGTPVQVGVPSMQANLNQQPNANDARTLRENIGPPASNDGAYEGLDARRIGQNALVSSIAQGGCFGLAFSLNNYLRANANPFIKQLAGFLSPILAGFLTSPAETAVRRQAGMQPTALPEGSSSGWHDAIPSVVLFSINKAYAKSRRLPKFAPGTRAGMATTVLLSVVGTGLAGGLGEAAAQRAGGRKEQSPLDTRATIERGMARAATLVPMGGANLYAARHLVQKGQLPPNLGLKPLGIGVVGWAGRNKLATWFSNRFVKLTPVPQNPPSPQSPQPRSDPPAPRDGW